MAQDFETFRPPPRTLAPDEVSLIDRHILISRQLAHRLGTKRVILIYSRSTRQIGICKASTPNEGYKVTTGRVIYAGTFYRYFSITARGRFPAEIDEFGNLMISLPRD